MKNLTTKSLIEKLAVAKSQAGKAARALSLHIPEMNQAVSSFSFSLDKNKLRSLIKNEGTYLLRTNLTDANPEELWKRYITLVEVTLRVFLKGVL